MAHFNSNNLSTSYRRGVIHQLEDVISMIPHHLRDGRSAIEIEDTLFKSARGSPDHYQQIVDTTLSQMQQSASVSAPMSYQQPDQQQYYQQGSYVDPNNGGMMSSQGQWGGNDQLYQQPQPPAPVQQFQTSNPLPQQQIINRQGVANRNNQQQQAPYFTPSGNPPGAPVQQMVGQHRQGQASTNVPAPPPPQPNWANGSVNNNANNRANYVHFPWPNDFPSTAAPQGISSSAGSSGGGGGGYPHIVAGHRAVNNNNMPPSGAQPQQQQLTVVPTAPVPVRQPVSVQQQVPANAYPVGGMRIVDNQQQQPNPRNQSQQPQTGNIAYPQQQQRVLQQHHDQQQQMQQKAPTSVTVIRSRTPYERQTAGGNYPSPQQNHPRMPQRPTRLPVLLNHPVQTSTSSVTTTTTSNLSASSSAPSAQTRIVTSSNAPPAQTQRNRQPSLSELLSSTVSSTTPSVVPATATSITSAEPSSSTVRSLILGSFSNPSSIITSSTLKPSVDRQQPFVIIQKVSGGSDSSIQTAQPAVVLPPITVSMTPVVPEQIITPVKSDQTPGQTQPPKTPASNKRQEQAEIPPKTPAVDSTSTIVVNNKEFFSHPPPNVTLKPSPANDDILKAKLKEMQKYKDPLKFVINMLTKNVSKHHSGNNSLQYLQRVYDMIDQQKTDGNNVTLQFLQKAESDVKILLTKGGNSPEMAVQMFSMAIEKATTAAVTVSPTSPAGQVDVFHSLAGDTFSGSLAACGDICFDLGDEWRDFLTNNKDTEKQKSASKTAGENLPIFPYFDQLSRPAQRELIFLSQNYALSVGSDSRKFLPDQPVSDSLSMNSSSLVDDGCIVIGLAPKCQLLIDAGVPAVSIMVPVYYPEIHSETPQILFSPAADFDRRLRAVKRTFTTMLSGLLEAKTSPSIVQLMSIFEAAAISTKC